MVGVGKLFFFSAFVVLGAMRVDGGMAVESKQVDARDDELRMAREKIEELSARVAATDGISKRVRELEDLLSQRAAKQSQEAAEDAADKVRTAVAAAEARCQQEKIGADAQAKLVAELTEKLSRAQGMQSKAEASNKELRAQFDRDLAKCRRDASLVDKNWVLIALERGQERFSEYSDQASNFYATTVLPNAKVFWKDSVKPAWDKVGQVASEQFEPIRPLYNEKVKPHLDDASTKLKKATNQARAASSLYYDEFMLKFSNFRDTAIKNVAKFSPVASSAHLIVNYAIYTVVTIIAVFTIPFLVRLTIAIVKGILFYGLCCCVFRRCCCLCRRSKPKQVSSEATRPGAPIMKPSANPSAEPAGGAKKKKKR